MRELTAAKGKIAYVLKNFPKLSETFIASEIFRLEQLGRELKLFVIKPPTENIKHAVVDKIRSERILLPATESLSETSLPAWLHRNFGGFSASFGTVLKKRPLGFARAARFALGQAFRARKSFLAMPRKVYLKEFLQACVIAEGILGDTEVRHIHAHFAHGATTVAWMASMMTGLRFSFTAHAKDIYLESLNPAGLLARKMDAAELVVTCTKANKEHLEQLSRTPVHCLYHGLNAEFSAMLAANAANAVPRNGHLRALAVGRLVPKKGLDVFIDACRLLKSRSVPFKARIVGAGGELEPKLREQIARFGLGDSVLLTGAMTQHELFGEYHRADVFCLPCRILDNGDRDGIPNVMVEAMSCGVPVVSTDVSGIPEIIENGVNGLLVKPEDAVALADSMHRLFDDRDLSARLSDAARSTVEAHFEGVSTAAELNSLFTSIIEARTK